MSFSDWEIFYTNDDDGIWITNRKANIHIGHCMTVQDVIDAIETAEKEPVMKNLLALFDTILARSYDAPSNAEKIEDTLYELGMQLGLSSDVIESALSCDRSLVVYEP